MMCAFMLCWAPFAWIYIVKLLGLRNIDSRNIYDMLPLLCVKLGCSVINPIVYVFEKAEVKLYCIHFSAMGLKFIGVQTYKIFII